MSTQRLGLLAGGLGTLRVRQTYPAAETAFTHAGLRSKTELAVQIKDEEYHDERGGFPVDVIETDAKFVLDSIGMQSRKEDIAVILADDDNRTLALQYYGMTRSTFQYYVLPIVHVTRDLSFPFNDSMRTTRLLAKALLDELLVKDLPFVMDEANALLRVADVTAWLAPHLKCNTGTTRVYDISGFAHHATLSHAAIWQADGSLLFNGTTHYADLGNLLSLETGEGMLIEAWVKIVGATAKIMSKGNPASGAGFLLDRAAGNSLWCLVRDNDSHTFTVESPSAVSLNAWHHVAVYLHPGAGLRMYVDGVAGSLNPLTGYTKMNAADPVLVAKVASAFGNMYAGAMRVHRLATPVATIAAVVSSHYAAERTRYGV